jgi:predicted MFS family arabinose efflux permease
MSLSSSRYGESDRTDSSGTRKEDKSNLTLLVATFQHMTKPYQMLIIPLTIWSGVEQGFFLSDYTAGFITCIYGVDQVGWVLITYGVCDAICSISFGVIIKYTGRPIIYVLGAVINLTVVLTLLTWDLTDKVLDQQYIFFILAGMWGVSDAVWQTQINGTYK